MPHGTAPCHPPVVAICERRNCEPSDGRGADLMQPMALPCIGGMLVDLISLFSVPCLYCLAWEWRLARLARRS